MEIPKITDGELHVMNVLWEKGTVTAAEIVKALKLTNNWNRNTTYTFINRLVEKNIVKREEPNFLCTALFSREEIGLSETKSLLAKMFNGSLNKLVASFVNGDEKIDKQELEEIKKLIESNF